MSKIQNIIGFSILSLFVFLLGLSYHPSYRENPSVSTFLTVCFMLLFIATFSIKSASASKEIKYVFRCVLLSLVAYMCTSTFFSDTLYFGEVRALTMCLMAITIGWCLDLSSRYVMVISVLYSLVSVSMGYLQMSQNVGGFIIENQYLTDDKNAIGVMLATSTLIMFYYATIIFNKNKLLALMCVIISIFSFAISLTIRARADSLSALTVVFVFLILRYFSEIKIKSILYSIIIVLCLMYLLPESISDYIYNSFFLNYENKDVSAGRTERNIFAIEFLRDNFFVGNLDVGLDIPKVHNYILHKLFNFGVIFSIPFLVVYFYILLKSSKAMLKISLFDIKSVGIIAILVPFVVSLFEYSFPFGPGTATIFNYVLLGLFLRESQKTNVTMLNINTNNNSIN